MSNIDELMESLKSAESESSLSGDVKLDVEKMIAEATGLVDHAVQQLDSQVDESTSSIVKYFADTHVKLQAGFSLIKEFVAASESKLRVAAGLALDALASAESKLVAASRMLANAEEKSALADEKLSQAKRILKSIDVTADAKKFRQTVIDFLDKVPSQSEAQIRNSVALLRDSLTERFVP